MNFILNIQLYFLFSCLTNTVVFCEDFSPCLQLKESCQLNGTFGWCCSEFCFLTIGQDVGFCAERTNCLEIGQKCHYSGGMGFCCSGICDQDIGDEFGICGYKNGTTPGKIPLENSSNSLGNNNWLQFGSSQFFGILFGSLTIILLVSVLIGLLIFRRKKTSLTKKEIREFLNGLPEEYGYAAASRENNNSSSTSDQSPFEAMINYLNINPYKQEYEVCEKDFTIDHSSILGSGEFSVVIKGYVRGEIVAAKTIRNGQRDTIYVKALLTELKVLIYIGSHPNIVSLIGANTCNLDKGACYIFVEFCHYGSLQSYLRALKAKATSDESPTSNFSSNNQAYISVEDSEELKPSSNENDIQLLMKWSIEIATGMSYLDELNVVHGDLAVRNVLLDSKLTAKISDFGLSKKLYNYARFKHAKDVPLPWRSMAPESLLQLIFSIKSDIWSFGITLWEIFSLGDYPYPGVNWSDQFVDCLHHNMRPLKPKLATDELYGLMLDCWKLDPESRPSFKELVERFKDLRLT